MVKLVLLAAALLPNLAHVAWAQAPGGGACPLGAADIAKAIGTPVEEGKMVLEIPSADMVMRDCRYKAKNYSVMVKTTRYTKPADAQGAMKLQAGKLRPVPNDADAAVIQEGQGDMTSPAVHYVRNGVAVELRVLGVYYKDLRSKDADLRAMQTKLVAIKRIP